MKKKDYIKNYLYYLYYLYYFLIYKFNLIKHTKSNNYKQVVEVVLQGSPIKVLLHYTIHLLLSLNQLFLLCIKEFHLFNQLSNNKCPFHKLVKFYANKVIPMHFIQLLYQPNFLTLLGLNFNQH
jgi:hypothetical protein